MRRDGEKYSRQVRDRWQDGQKFSQQGAKARFDGQKFFRQGVKARFLALLKRKHRVKARFLEGKLGTVLALASDFVDDCVIHFSKLRDGGIKALPDTSTVEFCKFLSHPA